MAESRHPADANDDVRSLEPRAQTATDVIDEMQNVCENLTDYNICGFLSAERRPPSMSSINHKMRSETLSDVNKKGPEPL